jgi:hypothetical protein
MTELTPREVISDWIEAELAVRTRQGPPQPSWNGCETPASQSAPRKSSATLWIFSMITELRALLTSGNGADPQRHQRRNRARRV